MMPSPYELRTRWLEWHNLPELESLKRQIETVKAELTRREALVDLVRLSDAETERAVEAERRRQAVNDMADVLTTLERLMPPF